MSASRIWHLSATMLERTTVFSRRCTIFPGNMKSVLPVSSACLSLLINLQRAFLLKLAPKCGQGGRGSLLATSLCFLCRRLGLCCFSSPNSHCDISVHILLKSTGNCVVSKLGWSKDSYYQGEGKGLPVRVLQTFVSSGNEYH